MTRLPASLRELVERRQDARHVLFRAYNDLRRQARDSEDPELHLLVGEAYTAFLRSFLNDAERDLLEAEDEITRLRAENALLRASNCPCGGAS